MAVDAVNVPLVVKVCMHIPLTIVTLPPVAEQVKVPATGVIITFPFAPDEEAAPPAPAPPLSESALLPGVVPLPAVVVPPGA